MINLYKINPSEQLGLLKRQLAVFCQKTRGALKCLSPERTQACWRSLIDLGCLMVGLSWNGSFSSTALTLRSASLFNTFLTFLTPGMMATVERGQEIPLQHLIEKDYKCSNKFHFMHVAIQDFDWRKEAPKFEVCISIHMCVFVFELNFFAFHHASLIGEVYTQ